MKGEVKSQTVMTLNWKENISVLVMVVKVRSQMHVDPTSKWNDSNDSDELRSIHSSDDEFLREKEETCQKG